MTLTLTRPTPDWSREQLKKHAKEITSALGNLASRLAGEKVARRVVGVAPLSPAKIGEDPDARPLLALLHALPADVQRDMEALQIGDALARIVGVLGEVRLRSRSFLLMLTRHARRTRSYPT